jgi:hypothetical protein
MEQRSPRGMAEEWRKQGRSGQLPCRSAMGVACRGAFTQGLVLARRLASTSTGRSLAASLSSTPFTYL